MKEVLWCFLVTKWKCFKVCTACSCILTCVEFRTVTYDNIKSASVRTSLYFRCTEHGRKGIEENIDRLPWLREIDCEEGVMLWSEMNELRAVMCVAVWCSAACCRGHFRVMWCITVWSSEVQCVTVRCVVVQCSTVQYSVEQCSAVQHDVLHDEKRMRRAVCTYVHAPFTSTHPY